MLIPFGKMLLLGLSALSTDPPFIASRARGVLGCSSLADRTGRASRRGIFCGSLAANSGLGDSIGGAGACSVWVAGADDATVPGCSAPAGALPGRRKNQPAKTASITANESGAKNLNFVKTPEGAAAAGLPLAIRART